MTEHMMFTAIYEYTSDGWCTAICLEIPGAVTQGRTIEEAGERLRDAIRELSVARLQKVAREPSQNIKVLEPLEL